MLHSRIGPFVVGILALGLLACAGEEPATPVKLLDLSGQGVDPFAASDAKAIVFLFTRTDCPVSNRYAPEVLRLYEEFKDRGVEFRMVYPNPDVTIEAIESHLEEYGYSISALRDPEHLLVDLTEATITPEAAVFVPGWEMVYRGRIDNRYVDFGKTRARATQHDLQEALEAALAGKPVPNPRTEAVGCFIADLR